MVHFRILAALPLILLQLLLNAANGQSVEGFTEPFTTIDLAVVEPGLLESITVVEGDVVEESEVVATLDSRVLQKSLVIAIERARSRGAIMAAEAEARLRRERLKQIKRLHERGNASDHELARAEADYEIALARVQLAKEENTLNKLEVDRIRAQIENRTVRSPVNGVVSLVHKRVGEAFSIGDPNVVTIVQLDKLRAKFSLSPSEAEQISVGQEVQVIFPISGQRTLGVVDHIAPVIDAKSGTTEVSVTVNNQDGRLRSGARCVAEFGQQSLTREVSKPSPSRRNGK